MLRSRATVRFAFAAAGCTIVAAGACSNGAVGVDACRSVEEARCSQAPKCGISIEPPYSTSGTAVDACIRYYDVACLHGLAVPNPSQGSVNACVAAIQAGDCALVQSPETGACSWLAPSAASSSSTDAAVDSADDDSEAGEASAP